MQLNDARKPWLAALMSLVLPGFGQLYNGQVNRAVWFYILFAFVALPVTALIAIYSPMRLTAPLILLSLLLAVGIWLYSVTDAWRTAADKQAYFVEPWQSGGTYVAVLLVCSLLALPLLTNYMRDHIVQAFTIPSNSMSPALQRGDYVFADMRYNCPLCKNEVARGDVAIFIFPNNRNRYYVKRIIGLPGDRIHKQTLVVSKSSFELESTFTVKPGHVFVLGDNRDASLDSRNFGQVPLADVVGRVRQIWFSKSENGIEWQRIGRAMN